MFFRKYGVVVFIVMILSVGFVMVVDLDMGIIIFYGLVFNNICKIFFDNKID